MSHGVFKATLSAALFAPSSAISFPYTPVWDLTLWKCMVGFYSWSSKFVISSRMAVKCLLCLAYPSVCGRLHIRSMRCMHILLSVKILIVVAFSLVIFCMAMLMPESSARVIVLVGPCPFGFIVVVVLRFGHILLHLWLVLFVGIFCNCHLYIVIFHHMWLGVVV